jgi:uncharacterized membrane protein YozB (DUF420 family)
MITLADLPALNATLNFLALVLLLAGYAMIRRSRVSGHKSCMISAYLVSILFLASYLTYRSLGREKHFGGQGWIRPVYYFILITHVVLALTVPLLSSWTLYLGLRGRVGRHRRMARVTFPIWIYVSVTGVLVYLLLFQLYGPAATSAAEP